MADLHNALVRACRAKFLRKGFKESKSPMPTYRPDLFAEKYARTGKAVEQVAVEAEIASTLFTEHTSHQLVLMDEFIRHQTKKRLNVRGYLVIPRGRVILANAQTQLAALFPARCTIRILQP